MEEITIRGTKARQNLLVWSERVADCRSNGQAVTRWCADHGIKPKSIMLYVFISSKVCNR